MKFSIVIPVYNVNNYIQKCIESLIMQTYSDFEVVFVDDGSTDGSVEIVFASIVNDKRFLIIKQDNQGVSSARNKGVMNAVGDYILFMDADDYIEADTLEQLANFIEKNDIEILTFGRIEEFEGKNRKTPYNLQSKVYADGREYFNDAVLSGTYRTTVWDKVFKRSFLISNDLKFKQGLSYCEDMIYMLQCFNMAQKVAVLPLYLYHYVRYRSDSVATLISERDLDILTVITLSDQYLAEYDKGNRMFTYPLLLFNLVSSAFFAKYAKPSCRSNAACYLYKKVAQNPIVQSSAQYCILNSVGIRQKIFAYLLCNSVFFHKIAMMFSVILYRLFYLYCK